MLKKFLALVILLFILLLIAFLVFVFPQFEVMTSFASRNGCTAIFVSNREADHFKNLELQFSPLELVNFNVDYENKSVTTDVFGFSKKTAYFSECGCNFVKTPPCPSSKLKSSPQGQWPLSDTTPDSLYTNIDYNQLKAAISDAFDTPKSETYSSDGKNTKAVVVIYKDQILHEKYMPGIDVNTPLLGWSMTKSIINTLIGILVKDGKLKMSDAAPLETWKDDNRKAITIDNLLRMNSGLEWEEEYAVISDVTKMLFKEENIPQFAIDKPLEFDPGDKWEYSSGTSNILAYIIKTVLKDKQAYIDFPKERLFDPIGMSSAFIEQDSYGNYIGSSYAYATARDWAKYGLLYLHDGVWNGEQILPEGWVDYTRTPTKYSKGEYGAHFWLNTKSQYFPDCPSDMYSASGFHGQRVYILPSHDMVIVRLGDSEDFDMNGLVSGILSSITFNK